MQRGVVLIIIAALRSYKLSDNRSLMWFTWEFKCDCVHFTDGETIAQRL